MKHGKSTQNSTLVHTTSTPSLEANMTVTFGSITIYEFTIAIGDCPFVTRGVPVRIDDMVGQHTLSVAEFESTRVPFRRTTLELRMPAQDRYQKLRSCGYSPKELKAVADAVLKTKRNIAEAMPSPTRPTRYTRPTILTSPVCKRSPIRMPRPTLVRKLFEAKGPIEISV